MRGREGEQVSAEAGSEGRRGGQRADGEEGVAQVHGHKDGVADHGQVDQVGPSCRQDEHKQSHESDRLNEAEAEDGPMSHRVTKCCQREGVRNRREHAALQQKGICARE